VTVSDDRARIDKVVDEILAPLLRADGGGLEIVSFDGRELVLTLTGAFRGDPGAPYVQSRVIKPVLDKALGRNVSVRWLPPRA
jgi:Fe-S cluster biogenesis protein NfuA